MPMQVQITRKTAKALAKLPRRDADTILDAIEALAEADGRGGDVKKLKAADALRLRVGVYRVIFDIEGKGRDRVLRVLAIGHRRDIYK